MCNALTLQMAHSQERQPKQQQKTKGGEKGKFFGVQPRKNEFFCSYGENGTPNQSYSNMFLSLMLLAPHGCIWTPWFLAPLATILGICMESILDSLVKI